MEDYNIQDYSTFVKTIKAEYEQIAVDREKRDQRDATSFGIVCILFAAMCVGWVALEYWELWP